MARLPLTPPPRSLAGRRYSNYKPWLEYNFYEQLCSYCLLQYPDSLAIEHYIPQAFSPEHVDDPNNLLLSCTKCNNGKGTYHPDYQNRNRAKEDNSGFTVLDVRIEDYAQLLELKPDGELGALAGASRDRVKFNILKLFKWNRRRMKKRRVEYLSDLQRCERLLQLNYHTPEIQETIDKHIRLCGEQYLFYKAFDVEISPNLTQYIEAYREQNNPNTESGLQ